MNEPGKSVHYKDLFIKFLGLVLIAGGILVFFMVFRERAKIAKQKKEQAIVENRIRENIRKIQEERNKDSEPVTGYFENEKNWRRLDFPGTGFSYEAPGRLADNSKAIQAASDSVATDFQYYKLDIYGNIDGYAAYFNYTPGTVIDLQQKVATQIERLEASEGYEVLDHKVKETKAGNLDAVLVEATFNYNSEKKIMKSILAVESLKTWQLTLYYKKDYPHGPAVVNRVFNSIHYTPTEQDVAPETK